MKYCWNKDTNTHVSSAEFAANAAAPGAGYTPARNPEYNAGFAARKGSLFSSNPRGHFFFNIPLSHIFGFAEYKKVIYGQKHTLTLTRGGDTQAIYRANRSARTVRLILPAFHGICLKYNYLQNIWQECDLS